MVLSIGYWVETTSTNFTSPSLIAAVHLFHSCLNSNGSRIPYWVYHFPNTLYQIPNNNSNTLFSNSQFLEEEISQA